MSISDFLKQIRFFSEQPAMIFKERVYDYSWLSHQEDIYYKTFKMNGIGTGSIVYLIADYTPEGLAAFIALMRLATIIVPISDNHYARDSKTLAIIQPDFIVEFEPAQGLLLSKLQSFDQHHKLIAKLRERKTAGLILFSSGSSGKPKAIVHDMTFLIKGLTSSKNKLKLISFLLFDHMGGINTILNTLLSGNCLVIPKNRTPIAISNSIQQYKVDVLITSPSFLNLMLISDVFKNCQLNCLKQINYGSEVMPSTLLERLIEKLPNTKFIQTYGLSELGVIRTRTNNPFSNSIDIVDKNIKYRIRNSKLEIQSNNSMLGYLNAASPFTDDGWFMTNDVVEIVDGSLRILGRDSELINVGGEKVFPAEIENILLQLPDVEDVSVSGEKNHLLGNIIVANIKLKFEVNHSAFKQNVRQFCLDKMPAFKVPQKINIVPEIFYGKRFKKIRVNFDLKG